MESGANSIFNSLQASYLKRMSSHFSLRLAYTYSHSIDDQSAFLGIGVDPNFPQNSHDLAAERADSSFDMRHRFVAAYVIDLPQGNLWTRNTEIRGITTIQSGQPFTPELNFDNSNTGDAGTANDAGTDRPNVVGSWTTGSCPNPIPGGHGQLLVQYLGLCRWTAKYLRGCRPQHHPRTGICVFRSFCAA